MQTQLLESVKTFMHGAEQTTHTMNPRQAALYIGLQLEEMAEKLQALDDPENQGTRAGLFLVIRSIEGLADQFKKGTFDELVKNGDRTKMLDANFDLAWVSVAAAFSEGADVPGAFDEGTLSNFAKLDPLTGRMNRDENGKVKKPVGWTPPVFANYISRDTELDHVDSV